MANVEVKVVIADLLHDKVISAKYALERSQAAKTFRDMGLSEYHSLLLAGLVLPIRKGSSAGPGEMRITVEAYDSDNAQSAG